MKNLLWTLLFATGLLACFDDNQTPPPGQDDNQTLLPIARVEYTLTHPDDTVVIVADARELGDFPEVVIQAGLTYEGFLEAFTEDDTPLTDAILSENDRYQAFYENIFGADISYGDSDRFGEPIGLETSLTAPDPTDVVPPPNLTVTLYRTRTKTDDITDRSVADGRLQVSFSAIVTVE